MSVKVPDSTRTRAHLYTPQITYRVFHALNREGLTLRERSQLARDRQPRLRNLDAACRVQRLCVLGGNLGGRYRLHGRITRQARLHRVVHLVYVAINRIGVSRIRPIGRRVYGRRPGCGIDVLDGGFDRIAQDALARHSTEREAIGVGEELTASLPNCDHLDEAMAVRLAGR